MVRIVESDNEYMGTDEGRMYLDALSIVWKCPNCSAEHSKQLNRDSYFYDCIEFNKDEPQFLYCDECESEFTVSVKVNVDVEITSEIEEVDED